MPEADDLRVAIEPTMRRLRTAAAAGTAARFEPGAAVALAELIDLLVGEATAASALRSQLAVAEAVAAGQRSAKEGWERQAAAWDRRARAAEAHVAELRATLAAALGYLDAEAGLAEPEQVAGQLAAVDARTGETRAFDAWAARLLLHRTGADRTR